MVIDDSECVCIDAQTKKYSAADGTCTLKNPECVTSIDGELSNIEERIEFVVKTDGCVCGEEYTENYLYGDDSIDICVKPCENSDFTRRDMTTLVCLCPTDKEKVDLAGMIVCSDLCPVETPIRV